ncbi:hypothetical protein MTR67_008080 [Solanum verrucosum]|uniref:Uncharacterized protein n=1 Tax=Solanum verrucosum TaxID=315347 RepID=A0AAF0TIW2_SOLVR|nr:hypothetical protein MTR67_008080 [Solanum verrucosum]
MMMSSLKHSKLTRK